MADTSLNAKSVSLVNKLGAVFIIHINFKPDKALPSSCNMKNNTLVWVLSPVQHLASPIDSFALCCIGLSHQCPHAIFSIISLMVVL